MNLKLTFQVAQSPENVYKRFDKDLFLKLAPPFPPSRLIRFDGCQVGDWVELELGPTFAPSNWVSEITEASQNENEIWFVDEGRTLPFFLKTWQHKHLISKLGSGSKITEDINFTTPFWIPAWLVFQALKITFSRRGPVYASVFGNVTQK